MSPRHLASASALALAALALPLAAPAHAQPRATPSARVAPDDGDDDAQYISGLAEKELWDMVVRESRAFLKERASHRRATLVRYLLGDALYEQGDFAGARPVFEKVLEQSGFDREREARFRAGQCALELGDAKAAAQRFEQVLAKDPGYLRAPASFLLGEARFRAKDLDGAEQAYWATIQVEDAGDYAFDAACAMCWTAKERGALDQVVQRVDACLDAAKKDDPRVAELRLLQGEAHYGLGAHAKALEAFRKVPDGPQKSAARRGAGHALVALGRDAEAADEFEALRDADPRGALAQEALVLAGAARVRAGQSQRALELLASASDAEGLYWRGRALAASNRHDEALRAYESATRAKPDEELAATIANARADSLYALGRTSEAAKVYEDAGGDYALHAAAVARANEGAYDDAIRLARSLIEKHPDSPYADATRFVLGEALFQKGDVAAARAEFEAFAKASKDAAKVREARARLAWCDFQEKKFDAAESAFAALLRDAATDAERAELEFMAARSAEERASGDQGAARSATQRFARVADRYPDSPRRPEALLRLARLVDGEAGEAFLERLAHDHPTHELADDALFDLAERRSARGALEPALAAYEELERLVPNSEYADRAAYGRAWCEHGLGRADAAAPRLDALARKRDLDATLRASAFELLVWVDADRGDARGAEQAVRELARLDVAADRVVAAARRAQQVLVEKGEAQRGAQLVAELARDTRDPDAAARLRVEEVFARLDLAAALEDPKARAKRVDEAEQVARGLASSRPDDPAVQEALFFVGEARYDAQDFERAIALYDLAAKADGEARERALYKGGFAAVRLEDWSNVETRMAALAQEFPKSALLGESLFLLGEARYRKGDDAGAMEALAAMRQRFPKHDLATKAAFRLGLAQARAGRHQDAARTLADLARTAPDFEGRAEAELWRGRSLAALGDRRAARAAFGVVLERDKGALSARARLELGELSRAENDLDGALSEFLKVAVLYEKSDVVADALVRAGGVLEAQGEKELALARYREVVKDHAGTDFAAAAQARIDALTKN